jgi:2-succinyl-5-enolpyruvyl-6-hydroxy-3-cyclohexene-1-carboxylate synthase
MESFVRQGITHVCVAPGSRSTPLAIAAAENKKLSLTVHFDERGLCFYALGIAKATHSAVLVITTSGSAVANLLPGVVEAYQSKVPLILLSADRPFELQACGANQTIDQREIFGKFVHCSNVLPEPSLTVSPNAVISQIESSVFQSVLHGPVHVNVALREPFTPGEVKENYSDYLAPVRAWMDGEGPLTAYVPLKVESVKLGPTVLTHFQPSKQGVIVSGELDSPADTAALVALSLHLDWPILADIRTGLGSDYRMVMKYSDQLTGPFSERLSGVQTILRVGDVPVSKQVNQWVSKSKATVIHAFLGADRRDFHHRKKIQLSGSVSVLAESLIEQVLKGSHSLAGDLNRLSNDIEQIVGREIEKSTILSEPLIARELGLKLIGNGSLFCSNSMPIRSMSCYGFPKQKSLVYANRGASGIDGIVATAAGVSFAKSDPLTLVIGDLALLHDLNSLSLIKKTNCRLIVINNNGGGIFSSLPVYGHSLFESLFQVSHAFRFEKAASFFDIPYAKADSPKALKDKLTDIFNTKGPVLLECFVDIEANKNIVDQLETQVAQNSCLV